MIKVIIIITLLAFVIFFIKEFNSGIAVLSSVALGIIIVFYVIPYFTDLKEFIDNVISLSQVNTGFINIILKITIIGCLIEFSISTIKDLGLNNLAVKTEFLGKILILSLSLPIFNEIYNLIFSIIKV